MNLKEFVSETLLQIIEGVKEAQVKASIHGGKVNPSIWKGGTNLEKHKIMESSDGGIIQIIDFDVALTVAEGAETKGGIGIFVGSFGIGSQGQSNAENTSASRVRFIVPVTLPSL